MKISEEFCGQGNPVSKSLKELTGLYGLSKTLRFELKPEEETKEKFDTWIKELENVNDVLPKVNLDFFIKANKVV